MQAAQYRLDSLPRALKRAAHSTLGAQALLFGLLLQRDPQVLAEQLAHLRSAAEPALFGVLGTLREDLQNLAPDLRQPLLDLSLPALKQLSPEEVRLLKANLLQLIKADDKVELLEWTLLRIVERNIEPPRQQHGKRHLRDMSGDVALLLSALAQVGHKDSQQRQDAFDTACTQLPFAHLTLRPGRETRSLDLALKRLAELRPLDKPRLLQAMAACVAHDGVVAAAEAELVRAVADTLGCPMPLLLGQR